MIFTTTDYKDYLVKLLEIRGKSEKGQRVRLAKAVNCHPAYLSLVLNGSKDFSFEQGQAANRYLGHTASESKYFLNLIGLARAGTEDLRKYYEAEIKEMKSANMLIKNRIQPHFELTRQDQAIYYSRWYYVAIHVAVSIAELKTSESIARAFALPLDVVSEVLEFLVGTGILKRKKQGYIQGKTQIHLGASSPFASQHHGNWRLKSMQAFDRRTEESIHYSSVITCGEKDAQKIRETMLSAISEIRDIVRPAKDERMYSYCLDLFPLYDPA